MPEVGNPITRYRTEIRAGCVATGTTTGTTTRAATGRGPTDDDRDRRSGGDRDGVR